jgi:c-di-GMP-related signal transduction protein
MSFYAARQAILDVDKALFAYELLFRDSLENVFPNIEDNQATSKMVEGLHFNLGLDTLTQGKPAFINFTHDSLLSGYPFLLPCDQVVVEILETVKPGKRLLEVFKELKEKGYVVALDDYEHQAVWRHFYPYTDIIKIDFQLTNHEQIKQIISDISDFPHIKLLAEKVETYEQFEHALQVGFCYFQGYFFSKPEVIKSISLSPSHIAVTNLMAEMAKQEPDIEAVTQAFEGDVNLSFKLLRYTQSPLFKRGTEISNIKQAIVLLGQQELRRFVSLLFSAQFAAGKPAELSSMSLIRARFCELMIAHTGPKNEQASAFLVGLLSLLSAMLDADLGELLEKIPLNPQIKQALTQRIGILAESLQLCEYFELADWALIDQFCKKVDIDSDIAATHYKDSLQWAAERQKMLS